MKQKNEAKMSYRKRMTSRRRWKRNRKTKRNRISKRMAEEQEEKRWKSTTQTDG